MKLTKNKEIKKLFIICFTTIIIFLIISIEITIKQTNWYKNNVNAVITNIIGLIKDKYPNVDDQEIIHILNSNENTLSGQEILKRYGINEESYAILSMQYKEKEMIITNCTILAVTSLILLLLFLYYLLHRQRKIEKLTQYIQKLSNKQYTLDIEENSEDELNSLKNELYKITVMLKEAADNSIEEKVALSNSVQDISHQLKTPLTSILVLLDNLNESENMNADTRRAFLLEITRQIKDMNFLIISLLQLSKLDAGVAKFENDRISINKLLKEIKSNLDIISEIRNINIQINEESEIFINGDYNWNKEALKNIIKNAVEYAKTQVKINISENSIYTKIEIEDDGVRN